MESHFIPKEEIGLASVFLYRLNGKQQGGGFFFVSSAFAVSLPLAGCVGHQGRTTVRSRSYRPLRALCGMEVAPVSSCQQPHQVEGTHFCRKDRGLLVWPCREGCIVLFGPVPPTICQHSCLVTCSLPFLLFTQDECDAGGFLQSRR